MIWSTIWSTSVSYTKEKLKTNGKAPYKIMTYFLPRLSESLKDQNLNFKIVTEALSFHQTVASLAVKSVTLILKKKSWI